MMDFAATTWQSWPDWLRVTLVALGQILAVTIVVILCVAALGLNVLVGYCGQISLGAGAFMAVGAYAAYNFFVRIDGMPLLVAVLLGGVFATLVGVVFGIPSLRIKGLYLAIATLAFGFIVVALFTHRLKGSAVNLRPAIVIGATYVAFGAGAMAVNDFDPFFLVFVIPGVLLLIASVARRSA